MSTYEIVHRPSQPYAAISLTTPMSDIGRTAPPLNDEVFGWLSDRGVAPAGPPFWKYEVIDMSRELHLRVGVGIRIDVGAATAGDDRVTVAELPAGRYLQTLHRGHPGTLEQATADLLRYAEEQALQFDVTADAAGERWASRLELYLTDPADEPDMNAWETVLAFKLDDEVTRDDEAVDEHSAATRPRAHRSP